MGKIIHGNQNLGFAKIDLSTPDAPKFGAPTMIEGLVETEIEVEQSTTPIYADNKVFSNAKGAKVRKATVKVRNIPSAYAEMLGFKTETNGMLVDTGKFPNHCIFFETTEEDGDTGESTQTLHYLYNVTASEPNLESKTDEDEIEAQEIEIEYQAKSSNIAKDTDGVEVQYASFTKTAQNKQLYNKFKEQVILPTTAIV